MVAWRLLLLLLLFTNFFSYFFSHFLPVVCVFSFVLIKQNFHLFNAKNCENTWHFCVVPFLGCLILCSKNSKLHIFIQTKKKFLHAFIIQWRWEKKVDKIVQDLEKFMVVGGIIIQDTAPMSICMMQCGWKLRDNVVKMVRMVNIMNTIRYEIITHKTIEQQNPLEAF